MRNKKAKKLRKANPKSEPNYTQIKLVNGNKVKVTAQILDVRKVDKDTADQIRKIDSQNGMSKYIPAKYGYGKFGPVKY